MTPQRGPRITGGQTRYQIGDVVRVNCTSYPSKPVCHLSWLINGEPANRSYLKYYDSIIYGRESLEIAILGLEFRVRGYHFKNGDMKLKVSFCFIWIAILVDFLWHFFENFSVWLKFHRFTFKVGRRAWSPIDHRRLRLWSPEEQWPPNQEPMVRKYSFRRDENIK